MATLKAGTGYWLGENGRFQRKRDPVEIVVLGPGPRPNTVRFRFRDPSDGIGNAWTYDKGVS